MGTIGSAAAATIPTTNARRFIFSFFLPNCQREQRVSIRQLGRFDRWQTLGLILIQR
jgi:hypothetical protein